MIVWVRWTGLPHPVESKKKNLQRITCLYDRVVDMQPLLTSVNKRTHHQLSRATLTIIVRPVSKNE